MYNTPLIERFSSEVEKYGKNKARLNVGLAKDLDSSFGGGVKKYLPGMQKNLKHKLRSMEASSNLTNMKAAVGDRLSRQHTIDSTAAAQKQIEKSVRQTNVPDTRRKDFTVIKGRKPRTTKSGIMASVFPQRRAA